MNNFLSKADGATLKDNYPRNPGANQMSEALRKRRRKRTKRKMTPKPNPIASQMASGEGLPKGLLS